VQSGLKEMLGVTGGNDVPFAANLAALIGVIAPPAATTWPANAPQPPFSATQIAPSIADPIGALACYYEALLTSSVQVGGQVPFYYVLLEMASLFQEKGSASVALTGSGTAAAPWRAVLSVANTQLPAALSVYTTSPSQGITRLFLGLELGPTLTLPGGFQFQPLAGMHFLSIDLPAPGVSAAITADWLPDASISFNLPKGFQTPTIANSFFSVANASLSASWSRHDSWKWSLLAAGPAFTIGGTKLPFSGDLNWNDQASLEALVLQSAASFAPVLVGVIGVALTSRDTRIGTALTGVLGLLPSPSSVPNFPAPLKSAWDAATLTPLSITALGNPWPYICAKLANDFASPANGSAVLGLLGWALNPGQANPPAVAGTGAAGTPWRVPLAGSNFELVVGNQPSQSLLGLGLGRTDHLTPTSTLAIDLQTTLAAVQLSTATGQLAPQDGWPSLQFTTTLRNPAGHLVQIGTAGSAGYTAVESLVLGFSASMVGGSLTFAPIVTLQGTQLPSQSNARDYTFQDLATIDSDLVQGFEGALNQAVQTVITALLGNGVPPSAKAAFSTAYDLLSVLGLTLPVAAGAGTGYGINPGGWQGLLADPLGYTESQLLSLLTDPAHRTTFFQFLANTLGIQLPTVPPLALQTLSTLGFLGDEAHGYPLRPQALLQFAQSPFSSLQAQFDSLFAGGALSAGAQDLVSALNQSVVATPFGKYFNFRAVQGTQIQLSIPESAAFSIGDFVTISGSVAFDLQKQTLSAEIDLYNPVIRLALQPSCSYTMGGSLAPGLAVVWGDGTLPSPESLTLFPFNSTNFVNQLSRLAPAYVLSTVVSQVLENYVLNTYPLAQFTFQALGLAAKDSTSGKWQMPSLLGLLDDPKGWLLSTVVPGNFSLNSLQKVLARIPAAQVASLNIGIKPYSQNGQTGVEIYGFPYGFGAIISTDGSTTSEFLLQTQNLAIASGVGKIEKLQGGLTLGPTFQPGVVGDLRISGTVSGWTLFAEAGFNGGFSFAVGQENTGSPLTLQLVPFQGWGTVIGQAVQMAAATLMNTLVPKLLTALKAQGSPTLTDFVTRLQTAGTDIEIASLVSSITAIPIPQLSADTVEAAVVKWLLARFNATNSPSTAAAIVALLDGKLPGTVAVGTGADASLVTYKPAKSVPLTVYLGVSGGATPCLGIWAGLGLPETSLLVATIERTGVGFPVAELSTGPKPVFQFGIDLQMPVEKGAADSGGPSFGPWLSLAFDAGSSRFVGQFDPLYNSAAANPKSALAIQLFPSCSLSSTSALETWLLGVMKNVLPRYVSAVVLNTDAVKSWLQAPLIASAAGSPSAATVLLGSQLITNDGTNAAPIYVLTPFDQLAKLTVEQFLGGLLYALMQKEIKVLSWGDAAKKTDGGLWIGPEKGTTDTLGVRVAAPGLQISALPNLTIQLGASDDDWITKASKIPPQVEPGLSFYVPNQKNAGQSYKPDFTSAAVNLVNVGVDFTGKSGRPLVDLTRFQLGGVSPRVLFQLAFANGTPHVTFGGAFELDSIALSLAPNQVTGSDNPVAQNLLGAGGTSDGSGDPGKNPPANPSFSVQAAYVDQLSVALLDADGKPAKKVWFPVQRGFGPLYVNKVGVGWEPGPPPPPLFDLLFDGDVALAGFELDLIGLNVGIPVSSDITDFSKYKLALDGFDLTFQGGPVSLTAEFLKTPVSGVTEYSGLAMLKVPQFSIMGVGSYAAVPTNPPALTPTATSLFIFGALNAPLGGVPAFFVTGIAAGFSYNRGLILPSITEVQTFPLVQGVVAGSFSSDPAGAKNALQQLSTAVYPEIGQYWLAAGIKFTSFQMLEGFALLFIEFGRNFEIALLGVASLALPKGDRSSALTYVELALKVVIDPGQGFVSVEARLTPNSFVIAKECKLTGGFAFYLWFKSQTQGSDQIAAGDFVVTLGGYASAFQKPAHYPDVPRLGFSWPIDIGVGSLNVAGGAYFALTPSAVMAGGYLKAMFEMGPIKAWFDANADFFIAWAPFYFEVDIGLDVGISFGTTIAGVSITLTVSLGANLHLHGPPTAGDVEVHWYVISFTIPFGEGPDPSKNTLQWGDFEKGFLPAPSKVPPPPHAPVFAAAFAAPSPLDAAGDPDQQQVLKLSADTGLVNGAADSSLWTLQSEPFILRIDSAIPIDQSTVTNPNAPTLPAGPTVGIQPANKSAVNTPLSVTIKDVNKTAVDLGASALRFDTVQNAAPKATWGTSAFNHDQTPDGSDMLIDGTLKTVRIIGDQCLSTSTVGPFAVKNLAFTYNKPKLLPFASQLPFNPKPTYLPSPAIPGQNQALCRMMSTIMDRTVAARRELVFQALSQFDIAVVNNPSLSVMRKSANLVVQAPPVLAHLGVFLAAAPQAGVVVPNQPPPVAPQALRATPAAVAPRLTGTLRRHRLGATRAGRWTETRRPTTPAVARAAETSSLLQPGCITHWEGPIARLDYTGEAPARFTCFDQNDELVADFHGHTDGPLTLPPGIQAVAGHGIEPGFAGLTQAGWNLADEVLRVNTRHFVGDGFALRPQACIAIRRSRRPLRRGLIDISAIQAANQVSGGQQGGIDTIFSGDMRTAAIRVPKGVRSDEIAVSVSYPDRPSDVRDYTMLTPAATLELENETIHFYTTDAKAPEPGSGHFSVWARALTAEAGILGIWASVAAPAEWMDVWKTTPPEHEHTRLLAAAQPGAAPAQGRLTLSATP
jgi:hypothetical protein